MAKFNWREILGFPALNPDFQTTKFPENAGDRERGKFRPSDIPRLTTVAVVDDDGSPLGTAAIVPKLDELIDEIRRLRYSLQLQGEVADLGDLDNIEV